MPIPTDQDPHPHDDDRPVVAALLTGLGATWTVAEVGHPQ